MKRPVALALIVCMLGACGQVGEPPMLEQRLLAMGTWVDLIIDVPDTTEGQRVVAEIERFLHVFERDYYAWSDDGALARLNAALARGGSMDIDGALAELLAAAQRFSEQSRGAYDPAVGELVELWGFESDPAAHDKPPDTASIEAWLKRRPSIESLTIDSGFVDAHGVRMKLDLGGIAKGEAVDRILRQLKTLGITNALINAGGDLRVLGSRRGRPWRIGIKAPRGPGLLGIIELNSGEAAFTSGDYERYYEYRHRRMHHILDPATGYPVVHTQAVTVIASAGVSADAAATALFVAGPEHWRDVARAMGIDFVLRVDASGRLEATPKMRERLQTSAGLDSDILAAGVEHGSLGWQARVDNQALRTD